MALVYATPEIRGLFEDRVRELTGDVPSKIEGADAAMTLESLAEDLGMSVSGISFLVSRLAAERRIRISAWKPAEASEQKSGSGQP